MMASGELTRILVHTDVTRYLEFKQVAASFVYRDGRIAKVPATEMEALSSPLMGLFEKRRARNFFQWLARFKADDPSTHQGVLASRALCRTKVEQSTGVDLDRTSMTEVYTKFGLEAGTQDFIGHAMALHLEDSCVYSIVCFPACPSDTTYSYLRRPARETYERIMLYSNSMAKYGKSPYIYPLYGLGELPQGFARLSAIYGGTYMLDKPVDEVVYDDAGKFVGIRSGDETVKAAKVIGDPSYFLSNKSKEGEEKVFEEGKVVRSICILKHPIPNTNDSDSLQLIIPQKQVNRKNGALFSSVTDLADAV